MRIVVLLFCPLFCYNSNFLLTESHPVLLHALGPIHGVPALEGEDPAPLLGERGPVPPLDRLGHAVVVIELGPLQDAVVGGHHAELEEVLFDLGEGQLQEVSRGNE